MPAKWHSIFAQVMRSDIYNGLGPSFEAAMHASRHDRIASPHRIPAAMPRRHVHLTQDIIEQLFCDRYRLHERWPLYPPKQFAALESVTLIGPGGLITHVPVIGPPLLDNQIEISPGDAQTLGLVAPLRQPGDLKGTPGVTITGPRASVRLDHGVILCCDHCVSLELVPDLARDAPRHGRSL
jgi:acetate kinase